MAYALAVAIIDGAALTQQFSPQRIDRDDVWELIPRIAARHDPSFDDAPVSRGRTRLRVFFRDGTMLQTERQASRAVLEPLGGGEIVAKYRRLTDGLIAVERQAAIERTVLAIETLPDAAPFDALLAPSVGTAFD